MKKKQWQPQIRISTWRDVNTEERDEREHVQSSNTSQNQVPHKGKKSIFFGNQVPHTHLL